MKNKKQKLRSSLQDTLPVFFKAIKVMKKLEKINKVSQTSHDR